MIISVKTDILRLHYIINIPPVRPMVKPSGVFLAVARVWYVRRLQSGKGVGNYSASRGARPWRLLSQGITLIFAASLCLAYIAHADTGVRCTRGGHTCAMTVCVLFASSISVIVFITSASAITEHSQLAKDIYPCFKF